MKSIKVRFNLGAGQNYMKWKIEYPDGKVEYHAPADVQLVMKNCILKNHRKTAQRIFDGGQKTVCAWVLCKSLEIRRDNFEIDNDQRIRYNPRVLPNWVLNGVVVDNQAFDEVFSVDFGLFLKKIKLLAA